MRSGSQEGHLAVRGNIVSFLLPWEKILAQLFQKIEDGDLSEWPLSPDVVRQIVRVRFVQGPEDLLSKFKELHVRSHVVKKLAHIYIERHVQDLADRPGVLQIHTYQRCADVTSSLKQHADLRVDALYPPVAHGQEGGALLPGLAELVQEQRSRPASARADPRPASSPVDSVFDGKQSTMHDTARTSAKVFEHVRPSIVTDEGETANTFAPEAAVEHAMHNVLDMTVRMSNQFEEQFTSKYMPRICPWALNYDCGGPEYPHLS